MSPTCFVLLLMHLGTQYRTIIDRTKCNLNNRPNGGNYFDVQNFYEQRNPYTDCLGRQDALVSCLSYIPAVNRLEKKSISRFPTRSLYYYYNLFGGCGWLKSNTFKLKCGLRATLLGIVSMWTSASFQRRPPCVVPNYSFGNIIGGA
jgi:hypothetical protein